MWYWRVSWEMWLLTVRAHRLIRVCSPKRVYMIFCSTDLMATSARCATLEFGRILRGNIVVKTTLLVKQEFSEWSCYNLVSHGINMYCDNRVTADLTKVFTVHGIASKYYVYNVSERNRSHVSDWGQVQNPQSCCGVRRAAWGRFEPHTWTANELRAGFEYVIAYVAKWRLLWNQHICVKRWHHLTTGSVSCYNAALVTEISAERSPYAMCPCHWYINDVGFYDIVVVIHKTLLNYIMYIPNGHWGGVLSAGQQEQN